MAGPDLRVRGFFPGNRFFGWTAGARLGSLRHVGHCIISFRSEKSTMKTLTQTTLAFLVCTMCVQAEIVIDDVSAAQTTNIGGSVPGNPLALDDDVTDDAALRTRRRCCRCRHCLSRADAASRVPLLHAAD